MDFGDDLIFYNWMPCVADLVYDYDNEYYKSCGVSQYCPRDNMTPECVRNMKPNDKIFIKTDFIKNGAFVRDVLPLIKVPFVLISGVSSFTIDEYEPILNNSNLLKWYCTNPPCYHDKVEPLPIGFEEREREGGDQDLLKGYYNSSFDEKSEKILMPYHTVGNNPVRDRHIEYLKTLPFVDVQENKLPFNEYLDQLSKYKYCICLEGAGFDTHRNYECLLTKTIPILLKTNVQMVYDYDNLPGEFVNRWTDLDENLYAVMQNKEYDFSSIKNFLLVQTHADRILND